MAKDDSIYIDHIKTSLDKITTYISSYDYDSFLESDKTQDAVIRQLEIIGEATKQEATKKRRLAKIIPMIKKGVGLNDKYQK